MTQIQSINQLAAIIRSQINSSRKSAQPGASTAPRRTSSKTKNKPAAQKDVATLIAQRVSGILPDDPERRRKAFRIFLESVLLAELGEELINDPRFSHMLDDIQIQMQSDIDIAPIIEQAVNLLLTALPD